MPRKFLNSLAWSHGLVTAAGQDVILSTDLPNTAVTPGTYTLATVTVDAAGRITAAVLAVLLRFLQDTYAMQQDSIVMTIAILAGASILFGNVLALRQSNIKRLLGYSSIAHFGYLLVAIVAAIALTLRTRKDSRHMDASEQVKVTKAERLRIVKVAPTVHAAAPAAGNEGGQA